MRSAPLILLAAAALLLPATALAASADPGAPPAPSQARYFEIHGLVYGDQKIDAMGKMSIENGQLSASVGCNMIGGPVSIVGDILTITGPTQMTEMACPGTNGDAEAGFIKVLGLGTFHLTPTSWDADGGQIFAVELTVTGPASSGPPDEPVSSGPVATIVDPAPFASCPPMPIDSGTTVGGGPVSGGDSSSGSSGSGSSGSGSTGTGTASPGTEVVPPDPGTITDPGMTPGSEPGATADTKPAATAVDLPLESGSVDPMPPAPDASGIYILPDPIGQDPNSGKPPVDGICYGSLGAGQVEADGGVPKAANAEDLAARDAAAVTSPVLPALIALIVLLLVGGGLSRRSRTSE
jgi:heat shock protein HslJ